jgi:hypothetical protein
MGGKESVMPCEPLRFLHASNLRLDAAPCGVGPLSDDRRRIAEDATLIAFERIADRCVEHGVEFLLLTGQTSGTPSPTLRAAAALRTVSETLGEYGIRVIVTATGDELVRAFRQARLPDSMEVLRADGSPAALARDGRDIAVVGMLNGCTRVQSPTGQTWSYVTADGSRRSSRHSDGGAQHDPGLAVGLAPHETGAHGATLVEVRANGDIGLQMVPVSPLRWERFPIAIDGDTTHDDLVERMQLALLDRTPDRGEALWLVRWIAVGSGSLFDALQDEGARQELAAAVNAGLPAQEVLHREHTFELRQRMSNNDDTLVTACADWIQQHASDAGGLLPECEGAAASAWTTVLAAAGAKLDRSAVAERAARCTRTWLAQADGHT